MRETPRDAISVVIPTFDRSALVLRALESVYAQSRLPEEVIVVDDGSSDATAERIAERFPQVTLLRQANAGVSAARNRGIHAARGRWIALLDSDDTWLPRKLERQIAALRDRPDSVLCHTDEIWIRRGRRVNPMRKHAKAGGWIFERCLELCAISPSSAVIDRALLIELGAFDESLPACEDYDLWLRVCARHPVLFLSEQLVVKYGGHDDQLSRRFWGMDRFRIRALEKLLEAGPRLSRDDRGAACEILLSKIDIYLAGARKRSRSEEVARYEQKRRLWADRLAASDADEPRPARAAQRGSR